jgi:hypothetical protein
VNPLQRLRRILAPVLVGALISTMAATGARAESDIERLLEQKVDPAVLAEIAASDEAEFWLRFAGGPDWSAAAAAETKGGKGEAAVAAARAFAEQSQADVLVELEAAGVEYEAFWGSPTVKVVGDADLLSELVARDEVAEVLPAPVVEYTEPFTADDRSAPLRFAAPAAEPEQAGPAWNLEQIRAPEVWADGFHGEGIVVASIDWGVDHTHPALVDQYRGNNRDGTFTHDYNFFDTSGTCYGEPCDLTGNGTYTMGLMVGDDGAGDRIGVAPEAEWIAVTAGFSMESFIEAGEWVAAPTDVRGDNADPLMAPHVVNTAYAAFGSGDPFMRDIISLWHAAGIVPVFPGGDFGDWGCNTIGSPAGNSNTIAVGATDATGTVPDWSPRGPAYGGGVKPDVVAPGEDVRSAVPGGYVTASGTAVASPQVAGAIALLMSASPDLERDYAETYRYLTEGAAPVDDRSCGGTSEVNNVYGYGVTDVYQSYLDTPDGTFGSLSGRITDDNDDPVPGARLFFDGIDEEQSGDETTAAVDRVAYTDADGRYSFQRIPAGLYEVTVTKFLHETATDTVEVEESQAAVFDAVLPMLPARTVEGAVVDGAGQGWPLAARVATERGEAWANTDPLTGEFSLRIPEDGDWPLTVEPHYVGYATVVVDPDDAELVEVPLASGCMALGYGSDVLEEDFETFEEPAGWSVVDRGEEPWRFDYPEEGFNHTPSSGGFAMAMSDFFGPTALVDTDMITPAFDLSAASEPVLNFGSYFIDLGWGSEAEILISVDGGVNWTQVWHTDDDLFDTVETVDLSDWATATAAQLMFHYTDNGNWAYFWAVDAVTIGCDPSDGGLVTGTVTDSGSGEPISGARVTDPVSGASAVADHTGRYVLFTDTGGRTIEASADGFEPSSTTVQVGSGSVSGADFALATEDA